MTSNKYAKAGPRLLPNLLGMWCGFFLAVALVGALLGWSGSAERVALVAIAPTVITSLVWWYRKGQHDNRR